MLITYLGHSCFCIEDMDTRIIIDPFYDERKFSPAPTHILVTHAHADHIGNTEYLYKKHKPQVISTFEVCNYFNSLGINNTFPMNIGGFVDFGTFKLKLVQAFHSSSVDGINNCGVATGAIIKIDDKILYHAGDTGVFGDMERIGKRHKIDIAFLPIGGTYTMDIEDAIYATKLISPKIAVPMHYNTMPAIEADPKIFAKGVYSENTTGLIFEIGETKDF